LAKLRLGSEVYLSDDPLPGGDWVLGYGNLEGAGWCLSVQPTRHEARRMPAQEAPAEVQQAVLERVPKLLAELGRKVEVALRGMEWARVVPGALPRLAKEAKRKPPGS
jgi:hypothetical protein